MVADQADGLGLLNLARDRARILIGRLRADAEDLRLNTKLEPAVAQRGLIVLQAAIESAERLLIATERAIEFEGCRGEE